MVSLRTIARVIIAVCSLALAARQTQASDLSTNFWSIAPEPDWVGMASSQTISVPEQEENTGQFYILLDQQTSLAREERYTQIIKKITSPSGLQDGSQLSFTFDPSYQRLSLHSIRILRGATVIDELDETKIKVLQQEKDLERHMYNGGLTAVRFLEDVRVGDIITFSWTVKGFNPIFKSHFSGTLAAQWRMPVHKQTYRILCPKDRPLFISNYLCPVEPQKTPIADGIEYLWEWNDIPALTPETTIPFWYDPYPSIQVGEYQTWQEVAAWASPMYQTPKALSPAMEAKVEEWKQLGADPEKRAIAALEFVQDEIRYLGIEMGLHSHEPTDPAVVFERRFGDCKDKAFLLCTLLHHLEIHAQPVLVNSVFRQEIKNWQPSPLSFDHVVVALFIDKKVHWVDATVPYQRGPLNKRYFPDYGFGLPLGHTSHDLVPVLTKRAGAPLITMVEDFNIRKNGSAELTVHTTREGRDAESLRTSLARTTRSELDKSYLDYYAQIYPNIRTRTPVQVKDIPEKNAMETVEVYEIPDMWTRSQDGTKITCGFYPKLISLALRKPRAEPRFSPLSQLHPLNYHQTIRVSLAEKWAVTSKTHSIESAGFKLQTRIDYQRDADKLLLDYSFQTLTNAIAPTNLTDYISKIDQAGRVLGLEVSKPIKTGLSTNAPWPGSLSSATSHSQPNWPLLLATLFFAIISAMAALFIYRHRPVGPPPLPIHCDPSLQGLGGWMILPIIQLVSAVFMFTKEVVVSPSFSLERWQMLTTQGGSSYHSLWAPTLLFELLGHVFFAIFASLLLVLLFQKRRFFPRLMIVFIILLSLFIGVDVVFAYMLPIAHDAKTLMPALRAVVYPCIWVPYFLTSIRVKSTFVN